MVAVFFQLQQSAACMVTHHLFWRWSGVAVFVMLPKNSWYHFVAAAVAVNDNDDDDVVFLYWPQEYRT